MTKKIQLVLLSIRPRFAEAILDGRKTVELRRRPPRMASKTLVLMYASSPRRAIVGAFLASGVDYDEPSQLWPRVEGAASVEKGEFVDYFRGVSRGAAIIIDAHWRLRDPIPLSELQRRCPGFRPPQSFRYLAATLGERLVCVSLPIGGSLRIGLAIEKAHNDEIGESM